jgi:hypothetical protein
LEDEKNRNLIDGAAQQDVGKVTAGARLKKTDACADLADHVYLTTGSRWTAEQTKNRWRAMFSSYKKLNEKIADNSGA